MTERQLLLKRVQICDFALNDAALFLDTHPEDTDALAYYKQQLELRVAVVADFEEKFGPITKGAYDGGPRWRWVDDPWPWQVEEEK